MYRMVDNMTPKRNWEDNFIRELASTGNVSAASKKVGIARQNAYVQRNMNEDFRKRWDEAIETAVDELELEARRRAHRGTLKPIFYKGEKVGQVNEYSDTLMIFLLKAHRPEKYRERYDVVLRDWREKVPPEQRELAESFFEQAVKEAEEKLGKG